LAQMRKKRRADGVRGNQNSNNNYNGEGSSNTIVQLPKKDCLPSSTDRIKFIRISHLMVGRNPFRPWNVITNILWSQLSRFELMGELAMEESRIVDTIVLRPGELTDDERNLNHTSLQLCIDGKVSYPSMVGSEDVADLVVVSALTKTCRNGTTMDDDAIGETTSTNAAASSAADDDAAAHADASGGSPLRNGPSSATSTAHSYTWAVRWTGQHLSPPQGLRPDGLPSAALCFAKAIKDQVKIDTRQRRKEKRIQSYHGGVELMRFKRWSRRLWKPFGQSLAVSVPLYTVMGLLGWYFFGKTFADVLVKAKGLSMPEILLKMLPS